MRKSDNNVGPYPAPQKDENFKQEVFRRDNKIPNLGNLILHIKPKIIIYTEELIILFFIQNINRMETTRYK